MTFEQVKELSQGSGHRSEFALAFVKASAKKPMDDAAKVDFDTLYRLYRFVAFYATGDADTALPVNSALRNYVPPGGSSNSAHLKGCAIDIGLTSEQREQLTGANVAEFLDRANDLRGFGVYTWGVHVDSDKSLDYKQGTWEAPTGEKFTIRYWTVGVKRTLKPVPPIVSGQNIGHKTEGFTGSWLFYLLIPVIGFTAFFILKRFTNAKRQRTYE